MNKAQKFFITLFTLFLSLSSSVKCADYYWVGGTGNWSDCIHHWATLSGGATFHTKAPGSNDDVYFDGNSFTTPGDTVFGNMIKMFCKNMNWTGAQNNPVLYVPYYNFPYSYYHPFFIYGSLYISDSVKLKINELNFVSTQPGNAIGSSGQTFDSVEINFEGVGGEWTLLDSLCGSPGAIINFNHGTFNSNEKTIRVDGINGGYPETSSSVIFDSSDVYCNYLSIGPDSLINLSTQGARFFCTYQFGFDAGHSFGYIESKSINGRDATISNVVCNNLYCDSCVINDVSAVTSVGGLETFISNLNLTDSNNATVGCFRGHIAKTIIAGNVTLYNAYYDTVIINKPGATIWLIDTIAIGNIFSTIGTCNKPLRIEKQPEVYSIGNTVIRKDTGTLMVDNAVINSVDVTGGATFVANNSIIEGNSTGWNFNTPTPRNLYWVGGAGNWSDINHWSLSSGGSGGNCIPNKNDSVFFDSNSFPSINNVIDVDNSFIYCKNLDFTGAASPILLGNNCTIQNYGSMLLEQGQLLKNVNVDFYSNTSNNLIKSSGQTYDSVIYNFRGSGTYSLVDSVSSDSSFAIEIYDGVFNSNNHNIKCRWIGIGSFDTAEVNLGTSKIICGDYWDVDTTRLKFDADSAEIITSGNFQPSNHNYYKVKCESAWGNNDAIIKKLECKWLLGAYYKIDTLIMNGIENRCIQCDIKYADFKQSANLFYNSHYQNAVFDSSAWFRYPVYFDTLSFITPGSILSMKDSVVINNEVNFNNDCSVFSKVQSAEPGVQKVVKKISGSVNFTNVFISDIEFAGGANFNAANSFENGNVTGINISNPLARTLYWVGGTGNWNDANHWSLISGGVGGNCAPNQLDDVFFDSNSFSNSGDSVFITTDTAYCKNMDWSGANQPAFIGINKTLNTYGSFTLEANMEFKVSTVNFESKTKNNTFQSKGQSFKNVSLNFKGAGGSWQLLDDLGLNFGPDVFINDASFYSNNHSINCNTLSYGVNSQQFDTLLLGTSSVACHNWSMGGAYGNLVDNDSITFFCDNSFSAGAGVYGDINCNNAQLWNNSFGKVMCETLYTSNTHINEAIVTNQLYGNWQVSEINTLFISNDPPPLTKYFDLDYINIHKLISFGYTQLSRFEVDTLVLNGDQILLSIGDSLRIKSKLIVNSLPDNPAFISGANFTNFAVDSAILFAPENDTICLDYIYLEGIHANDTDAVFFAGNYSVDLGNNTGWNWTSCTPAISNVWPGDANYDLNTDNFDLLYIGLAYSDTGVVRPAASLNYVAQPCTDWNYQFANGANVKHADTDGNGIVNSNDTVAVSLNYGLTHPFKIPLSSDATNSFGTDLYFQMPTGVLNLGDTIDVPILLGTATNLANNVYGIAFTINYDAALVQQGTMSIDYNNSWVANSGNYIHLEKNFPSDGKLDIGFSLINHTDISGYGVIATLHFVVGINPGGQQLNLSFSHIKIISHFEIEMPVNPISDFGITGISDPNSSTPFYISPNPMHNQSRVVFDNFNHSTFIFRITDIAGRLAQPEQISTGNEILIEQKKLSPGIYFVSLCNENDKTFTTRKLVIE